MTYEIKYPNQTTYWIFWTDKVSNFVYGFTNTNQQTETSYQNYWITLNQSEWLNKLKTEFNIIPVNE